jgi:hypothetical protein
MANSPDHMTVALPVSVGEVHVGDIKVRIPITYTRPPPYVVGPQP